MQEQQRIDEEQLRFASELDKAGDLDEESLAQWIEKGEGLLKKLQDVHVYPTVRSS